MEWSSKIDGLEENTLCFSIYDLADRSLKDVQQTCWNVIDKTIEGYVWLKDAFHLTSSEEQCPVWNADDVGLKKGFLWGLIHFGDTVDEEWFMTSLLMKITEHDPLLVARMWDNDGEFLLIECAYVIPKWLQPSNSHNRVWIKEGKIHIIPRNIPAKDSNSIELTSEQSIDVFRSGVKTEANGAIQKKIERRVTPFPVETKQTQHWARAILPLRLAWVLERNPRSISAMVDAYLQHVDGSRLALHCFEPKNLVQSMVKFHRCSYAQLIQADYHPPKGVPPPDGSQPNSKFVTLGMKITCGAELLYRRFESQQSDLVQSSKEELSTADQTIEMLLSETDIGGTSIDDFHQSHQLFAEDDDTWLNESQKEVEKELKNRDAERRASEAPVSQTEAYDPSDLIHSLTAFVDNVSSHEGAEVPNGVQLDSGRFMAELKSAMGAEFEQHFAQLDISEDDTESFSDDSSSFGDSSDEGTTTESDSDDDSDFNEAYEAAMQSELRPTTLERSFVRSKASPADVTTETEIDLNGNLVESLLESQSLQRGAPGPVTQITASLDIDIPKSNYTSR